MVRLLLAVAGQLAASIAADMTRRLVIVACLGLCIGCTRDQSSSADRERIVHVRRDLSELLGTARGMANKAWSADDTAVAVFCDRMLAALYRAHGYLQGFNARLRLEGTTGNNLYIEADMLCGLGSVDFDVYRADCLRPDGIRTSTRESTDGSAPTTRTRPSREALMEDLALAERQITASLARCSD